jgi:2-aminobenzoate-CoA ligase
MSSYGKSDALVDRHVQENLPPPDQWPVFHALPEPHSETFNATSGMLDAHIGRGTDRHVALIEANGGGLRAISYGELYATVNRICGVLVDEMGVQPGNRVLLRAPNNAMLAACWLAVVRIGAVAVTTMPLLRAKELSEIACKAQVQFALCDHRYGEEMERCVQSVRTQGKPGFERLLTHIVYFNSSDRGGLEDRMRGHSDDFRKFEAGHDHPAIIAFTSGTTGMAKGTVHFHRDLQAICDIFPRTILDMSYRDRCCGTPPLGFTFGLGGLLCFPLTYGASAVLAEKITPDSLLHLIDVTGSTINFTAPTLYRKMIPRVSEHRLHTLRACISAGEPLPNTTREQWRAATGLQIIDGLGSTEMLHIFIATHTQAHREGSVGRALPGYEVAVLSDDLQPLAPGTLGRLAVRGPTGCRYLADARQMTYVREGWNLTGDVGTLDEDGYFSYFSRADDMIISAGYNISGPEIETILLQHPAVSECAVVGWPDEERGQLVKAYVVLHTSENESEMLARELQDFVKCAIAPYKYPRVVEFCRMLPRTETGKLQRFRLREIAAAGDTVPRRAELLSASE